MTPAWATYAGLRAPVCVYCCVSEPECACALFVPTGFGTGITEYTDFAAAQLAIADYVYDCDLFVESRSTVGTVDLTALITSSDLIEVSYDLTGGSGEECVSLDARTVTVFTVSIDAGTDVVFSGLFQSPGNCSGNLLLDFGLRVFNCNYEVGDDPVYFCQFGFPCVSFEEVFEDAGQTLTFLSTPFVFSAGGTYTFIFNTSQVGSTEYPTFANFQFQFSAPVLTNPVIARWDDSGTPRRLEACPRLRLPILTESTGDWYASEAAANTALTTLVSNCVGYSERTDIAFVATDGGSSLTLFGQDDGIDPLFTMWGSVNVEPGETLSAAFTITNPASAATVRLRIYDDAGMLLQTLTSTSATGTLTSSALVGGRYLTEVRGGRTDGAATSMLTATFTLTATGTMTVNPVAALWDDGFTCPTIKECV